MQHDIRGLPLTTSSATAAAGFDQTLTDFLNYELSASKSLKGVLAEDDTFVMGYVMRGYLLSMLETSAIRGKVNQSYQAANANANAATPREQRHVEALGHVSTGDVDRALRVWEDILQAHPHDLLALKMHHYTTFWTGRSPLLKSVAASVDPAWDDSIEGYGYVLGMQAFGFEEAGDYERAERLGRKAVDLNPEDLWAIHGVAHVLESTHRASEGLEWLNFDADRFASKNPFAGHIWWHRSLFEISLGNHDGALALYDERVRASSTDFYLDVQNMASLLKRLELCNIDVGDRWDELAEHAQSHVDDHALAFTDVHNLLALAAGGKFDDAGRMIDSMTAFANTPDNYVASTMTAVTVPLSQAIVSHERGEHADAARALGELRHSLSPIGGSHAQRDLFVQMMIKSAIEANNLPLAQSLLGERAALGAATALDLERYARVLGDLPQSAGNDIAKQRLNAET